MATAPKKKKTASPRAKPRSPRANVVSDGGLAAARRVFEIEAEGLTRTARGLDGKFVHALDLLAGIKGRIIVSGMGKSGHIAHKIAATLASTGSPAFFVHPGEASHGDLGMITRDDAVIALSNSGTTAELSDLIAHTRRFSIPLVAITSGGKSQLADAADVVLALARVEEACPMGLAPTTSTTMTLAMGDAIAIALLERRGFTSDDFQLLHPGGQLGKKLLKVGDIMHRGNDIPRTTPNTAMSEVLITMTAKRFGCIAVTRGNAIAGVITDGDLRRHMAPNLVSRKARDIMTPAPVTIGSNALAMEALGIMNDRAITTLFVVDDGQLTGIVHIHDILHSGVA